MQALNPLILISVLFRRPTCEGSPTSSPYLISRVRFLSASDCGALVHADRRIEQETTRVAKVRTEVRITSPNGCLGPLSSNAGGVPQV